MRIGELSRETGLNTSTIRYYDSLGLLRGYLVNRSGNNYREFLPETVAMLRLIQKFTMAGFTLREMKTIISENQKSPLSLDRVTELLFAKATAIDERIQELHEVRSQIEKMISHKRSRALDNDGRTT
jgi:DNA-binding transcriptional MerR regulator